MIILQRIKLKLTGPSNRRPTCFVCSTVVQTKQEAQLSQRDRATLHVIEYFAKSKSLKVTQGHSK